MYIVGCLPENLPPHNFTNFLSGPSREPQANPIYHQIDSISSAPLLIGCLFTRPPTIGWNLRAALGLVEDRVEWRSILRGFIPSALRQEMTRSTLFSIYHMYIHLKSVDISFEYVFLQGCVAFSNSHEMNHYNHSVRLFDQHCKNCWLITFLYQSRTWLGL